MLPNPLRVLVRWQAVAHNAVPDGNGRQRLVPVSSQKSVRSRGLDHAATPSSHLINWLPPRVDNRDDLVRHQNAVFVYAAESDHLQPAARFGVSAHFVELLHSPFLAARTCGSLERDNCRVPRQAV